LSGRGITICVIDTGINTRSRAFGESCPTNTADTGCRVAFEFDAEHEINTAVRQQHGLYVQLVTAAAPSARQSATAGATNVIRYAPAYQGKQQMNPVAADCCSTSASLSQSSTAVSAAPTRWTSDVASHHTGWQPTNQQARSCTCKTRQWQQNLIPDTHPHTHFLRLLSVHLAGGSPYTVQQIQQCLPVQAWLMMMPVPVGRLLAGAQPCLWSPCSARSACRQHCFGEFPQQAC